MSWADPQWNAFCALMEQAWPGEFDDGARESWRLLLDGVSPETGVMAMKRLLYRGERFRPSVAEFLSEVRSDPSQPTFEEAFALIFEAGGVLRAQPQRTGATLRYNTEPERRALFDRAARERAADLHPLIASFVERFGLDRLRALPVADESWGTKHQKDLRDAWNRHVEASEGREIAVLASGGTGGELRKLDPLAALGLKRAELTA